MGDPQVTALVYVDAFIPDQDETIGQLAGARPGSCLLGNPADIFTSVPYPGAPADDVDLYIKPSLVPGCFATGLPPGQAAVVAAATAETVARNLDAELRGRQLEPFTFHDRGFVVSVAPRRGVADIAGVTSGGRLAYLLKDTIEWEYRQSVRHLRGWDPVAV